MLGVMFLIGEAIVDEGIAFERFACDLAGCRGACCTLKGGRGAPLTDEEADEIERAFPQAKRFLPERSLQSIATEGMVEGSPGHLYTVCIDNKDCVFVYYEEGIARCALERAYLDGLTGWRKPLSCHLFPIRVDRDGSHRLRYEEIPECRPGRALGASRNVPLYVFLKDPLIRAYGEEWYREFQEICRIRDDASGRSSG